jgi:hypothetical protein
MEVSGHGARFMKMIYLSDVLWSQKGMKCISMGNLTSKVSNVAHRPLFYIIYFLLGAGSK